MKTLGSAEVKTGIDIGNKIYSYSLRLEEIGRLHGQVHGQLKVEEISQVSIKVRFCELSSFKWQPLTCESFTSPLLAQFNDLELRRVDSVTFTGDLEKSWTPVRPDADFSAKIHKILEVCHRNSLGDPDFCKTYCWDIVDPHTQKTEICAMGFLFFPTNKPGATGVEYFKDPYGSLLKDGKKIEDYGNLYPAWGNVSGGVNPPLQN